LNHSIIANIFYFRIANSYTTVYNNIKNKKGGIIMATKSANVLARVEPETKEKAETIMSELGLPASVVINALYKQIILTKSIPFSLSLPKEPPARDTMTTEEFSSIMQAGLSQAKADQSRPVSDVFADLRRELR
jgi:DNA-damage-inducible protein J